MLNSKKVGSLIAQARKKNNLSQAALAERVAISPQAIGKWERGESMPDITVFHRLAGILGVDLNYFTGIDPMQEAQPMEWVGHSALPNRSHEWNWDMSQGNWTDADFSGLKNLGEQFSASNMKNCKFRSSDLSGLKLGKNNIESCDFAGSNLRNSAIHSSNLLKNQFADCSFIDAEFAKSNIGNCDFERADFSGCSFLEVNFERNILSQAKWNFTSFRRSNFSDIVWTGELEDCRFEECGFYKVRFEGVVLRNTFFKHNKRFKKVEFVNCQADRITIAFLKNNHADTSGILLLD